MVKGHAGVIRMFSIEVNLLRNVLWPPDLMRTHDQSVVLCGFKGHAEVNRGHSEVNLL